MPFWKKSENNTTIQCSKCEWKPDGKSHWECSCGNSWNTFETKAICPKCKFQWKNTWCPGCNNSTLHKDWYKTKEDILRIENGPNQLLRRKKLSLESRLIKLGIYNYRVTHLPYLDHTNENFKQERDAATRMIILYCVSHSAHNLNDRALIIQWFKNEKIWNKTSEREQHFLLNENPSEENIAEFSWKIEGAITLGWCLNKIEKLTKLDQQTSLEILNELEENIPSLGEPLENFLSNLEYIDLNEIYEENLLNEMATTYFRDLYFIGNSDETKINRNVIFERHLTLNWLRNFMGNEKWDEIDTST